MNNYFELVREHYDDEKYSDCIENLSEWFRKKDKSKHKENLEFETLRMSLFEN
jgi:hypothetical protein